ncbi:MAG: hypothetical protein EBT13_16340 [Rhodobacteraceae bacterium]|nr:hypothetical protein [Paracoccaceae bacterium]
MTERLPNGRFPKGNGPGWGGPAKGNGSGGKRAPLLTGGAPTLARRIDKLMTEADRQIQAEAVKDEIFRIALQSADDAVRVNAGKAFLDRVEGTPVARQLTISVDAEKQAVIDRPPAETREEWLRRKAQERVVSPARAAG